LPVWRSDVVLLADATEGRIGGQKSDRSSIGNTRVDTAQETGFQS